MRLGALSALALLAATAAGGQGTTVQAVGPGPSGAEAEALEEKDYCTVEGIVVDATTQAPLRKASVTLFGGPDRGRGAPGAVTDAAGRFRIDRLAPGRYQISVRRNGYAMTRGGSGSPSALTLSRGEHVKGLVLRLQPAAVITGRVLDEDGEPLVYAQVSVVQYRYARSRPELAGAGGTMTNDRGEYRIFGLAPGRYYVSAAYQDRFFRMPASGRKEASTSYPTLYYPGVLDPEQAVAIQLKPGEERSGIDFRLSPVQAVSVSGRVVSAATGRPIPDVGVTLVARREGSFGLVNRTFQRADPSTGKFVLAGVRPGSYVLAAFHRDGEMTTYARQPIEVGPQDVEGVELVLAPGATLRGRVAVESGAGALKLDETRVYLEPLEEELGLGRGDGRIREDGTFELRNVAPGRYAVQLLRLPEGSYLKAARLGDQDVLSSGLTILPGSGAGALELLISPFGGRLDGVVLDADKKPCPGAVVVLAPEPAKRSRADLFFQQSADQYGRFSFRGLPPGEYKVFAWDKIDYGAYRDPEFLERFEDEGVKVSIKEQSAAAIEAKLLHASEAEP